MGYTYSSIRCYPSTEENIRPSASERKLKQGQLFKRNVEDQKTTCYLARNRTLRSLLHQFALKMVDGNPDARPNINQVLEELAEMHMGYIKNKNVPKILVEEDGVVSRLRR